MDTTRNQEQSKHPWRRGGIVAVGLAVLLAAAAGIAWAAGAVPGALGHGFCRHGMGREFAEFRIQKVLKQVNATDAQEQQITAIVDGLFAKHEAMAALHQQVHDQLLAALAAPTVDRTALETVRAEVVTRIDQGSKDLAKAMGDIAEVLTPAQRQQLAALAKEHMRQ